MVSDLLSWAERWHYPYLRLSNDAIRHGQQAWETFAKSQDSDRKQQAWQRIARWNELATERENYHDHTDI